MTNMLKPEQVETVPLPTMTPERQLLWEAANYMEKHGKAGPNCDGADGDRLCVVRALIRVSGDARSAGSTVPAEKRLAAHVGLSEWWLVPRWSDNNDQATVVKALRSAAVS